MSSVIQPVALLKRPRVRRAVVVLLWIAAFSATATHIAAMLSDPVLPGEDWRTASGYLLDFRDIIVGPGRFVLDGGNPYDPATYLVENPWAQEFDPYAPAWLLLAVLLAPLPFLISAAVFQILSVCIAILMLRVICRWALPGYADMAVPAGLIWMTVWYPGRGSLSALGTVLAVLGMALVLRAVIRSTNSADRSADVDLACAAGISIALIKPQFGLAVAAAGLAGGRVREVLLGTFAITLLSIPMLVVCAIAGGGPFEFVFSVLRDLEYANSAVSPGGLASPFQQRIDILGMSARYGADSPPDWLTVAAPILALVAIMVAVRMRRSGFVTATIVCTVALIGLFHPRYDLLILFIPCALGVGLLATQKNLPLSLWIALVSLLATVAHLHSVSTLIFGFDRLTADTVDSLLVLIAFASVALRACCDQPNLAWQAKPSGVESVFPRDGCIAAGEMRATEGVGKNPAVVEGEDSAPRP